MRASTAALLTTFLLIFGQVALAENPARPDRGPFDGDPGPQDFSTGTASWPNGIDIGRLTVHKPTVQVVDVNGHRRLKLVFYQIRPTCNVETTIYAEIFNGKNRVQEVRLLSVRGASNRPERIPEQPLEAISLDEFRANVTEKSKVGLSIYPGCAPRLPKPGGLKFCCVGVGVEW